MSTYYLYNIKKALATCLANCSHGGSFVVWNITWEERHRQWSFPKKSNLASIPNTFLRPPFLLSKPMGGENCPIIELFHHLLAVLVLERINGANKPRRSPTSERHSSITTTTTTHGLWEGLQSSLVKGHMFARRQDQSLNAKTNIILQKSYLKKLNKSIRK